MLCIFLLTHSFSINVLSVENKTVPAHFSILLEFFMRVHVHWKAATLIFHFNVLDDTFKGSNNNNNNNEQRSKKNGAVYVIISSFYSFP